MRKSGRTVEPLTEKQKKAVEEYLNTDRTAKDVAKEYKTTDSGLRYWVKKYKAEKELSANG